MQSCGDSSSKVPILRKRLEAHSHAKKVFDTDDQKRSSKRSFDEMNQGGILPPTHIPSQTDASADQHSPKEFSSLLFVEVFSSTGGLTASVKKLGVQGLGLTSLSIKLLKVP